MPGFECEADLARWGEMERKQVGRLFPFWLTEDAL